MVSRSKKSVRQTSAPEGNLDPPHNNLPEIVLGNLLQFGIAGGKIEQARQIWKAIQETDRVSIDGNNLNSFVDQQETSKNITDSLTALQGNTRQLFKQFFNLVEILALPRILLANTYARQASSTIQNPSVRGESPRKRIKVDTDLPNSCLTIWVDG